jgi:hypothetical protein
LIRGLASLLLLAALLSGCASASRDDEPDKLERMHRQLQETVG